MTIIDLAEYVINFALKEESPISNLQLQKILYFIIGEYYKKYKLFICDDPFYAYPYGPVNNKVYKLYKGYGTSPILNKSDVGIPSQYDENFINASIKKRLTMNPFELVKESHKSNGAWSTTFNNDGSFAKIPKDLIMMEFTK